MPTLLVVHHTPSPAMHTLLEAVLDGARDPVIQGVGVVVRPALSATASDVLSADGYLLGSPVNLGYISGALKHFFDQIYYPCLDATRGRPFGVWLHGDNDATGAIRALETITAGLRWRAAQSWLVATGPVGNDERDAARELGSAIAAGLALDAG